ncbi:biopolymer transporter ExbD [Methylococcus sp. EFPC2]|uniref:ExbD/TolR family protein n=1 Tax=Methylococcus sp. EFPC2 TaxID=2812648 RepID=UPI0019676AB8|nr:biopolymer transporter ExbD [Methylococcus sp. EFPC2]QSA97345.1 biopolymer transporter ExbD [Methylococcus sp. EFPC2]
MNFRPRREDKPELNLIPMIDVLIVLLIFLVLTTTFSREASLHISLPEASAQASAEEKGVDIVIDAAGRYIINRHQLINNEPDTVKKALQEAAGEDKDPLIVISADQKTPHQAVMTALDAASQLGYVHITFAAKTAPGEAAEKP